jgi:hypothetical protein
MGQPTTAGQPPSERPVLSAATVLEILAYLVTAARTQVDEAAEYGPMRLMTGARRLAEQLSDDVVAASGPAQARFLRALGAAEPTATPTRNRSDYVQRLDALCELAADALLETNGRTPAAGRS